MSEKVCRWCGSSTRTQNLFGYDLCGLCATHDKSSTLMLTDLVNLKAKVKELEGGQETNAAMNQAIIEEYKAENRQLRDALHVLRGYASQHNTRSAGRVLREALRGGGDE